MHAQRVKPSKEFTINEQTTPDKKKESIYRCYRYRKNIVNPSLHIRPSSTRDSSSFHHHGVLLWIKIHGLNSGMGNLELFDGGIQK